MALVVDKVLVLLNSLEMARAALERAIFFANRDSSIVEILYVHQTPMFEIPDYFLPEYKVDETTFDKDSIKEEIAELIRELNQDQKFITFVFIDDAPNRVLTHAKDDKNSIIVTNYSKKVTEKLVKKVPLPTFVVKKDKERYRDVLIYLDSNSCSKEYILDIKSIFKESNIELLYDYRFIVDPSIEVDVQNIEELEKIERESFESLKKESSLDGDFFVDGAFLGDDIVKYILKKDCDIVTIFQPKRDFLNSNYILLEILENIDSDILIY